VWAVLDVISEDVLSRETIVHSYPHDWRTKQPLIVRASQQWFVDTAKLKQRALVGFIYMSLFRANSFALQVAWFFVFA